MHREIIFEKVLRNEQGELPEDYKFFCMNGKVLFIQVDSERMTGHRRAFYTPEWKPLDVTLIYPPPLVPVKKPERLKEMISVAGALDAIQAFSEWIFTRSKIKLFLEN
jgi:hypothetical protein